MFHTCNTITLLILCGAKIFFDTHTNTHTDVGHPSYTKKLIVSYSPADTSRLMFTFLRINKHVKQMVDKRTPRIICVD